MLRKFYEVWNIRKNEKGYFLVTLLILLPVLMLCTYLILQLNTDRRVDQTLNRVIDRAAFAASTKIDFSQFPDYTVVYKKQKDAKRYAAQLIYDNLQIPGDDYLQNIDLAHNAPGVPQKIIPLKSLDAELQIMGIYIVDSWFRNPDPSTTYDPGCRRGNPGDVDYAVFRNPGTNATDTGCVDQTYFEYADEYFKVNKKLSYTAIAIVARIHYHDTLLNSKPYKYLYALQEIKPADFS